MSKRLRWTRRKPEKLGFYWVKVDEADPALVSVYRSNGVLFFGPVEIAYDIRTCHSVTSYALGHNLIWAGPILPPSELEWAIGETMP